MKEIILQESWLTEARKNSSASVTLYHVTPTKNLRKILQQGLIPQVAEGEDHSAIYFFRDKDSAEEGVMNWEKWDDVQLALLEVTVSPEQVSIDNQNLYEVEIHTPIPVSQIRVVTRDM